MRTINFLFSVFLVTVVTMCVCTSCSDSENDLMNSVSGSFESVKSEYGIEEVSSAVIDCSSISVTMDEMVTILTVLRQNGSQYKECTMESCEGGYFNEDGEYLKQIIMSEKYDAVSRSGNTIDKFVLRVELNFDIDNHQIYYLGTDYFYDSTLFEWRANGLTLCPVKNSKGNQYEFESESYLFFRISELGNNLVKVPIVFKGSYDFASDRGTYVFKLKSCNQNK